VAAIIDYVAVPKLEQIDDYLDQGCSPGGAQRNYDSYGHKIGELTERQRQLLCDPQTSGGLLVAVTPEAETEFLKIARSNGFELKVIGELTAHTIGEPLVEVR
ncbi:MAG: AIR synthase-related protein, partial [Gammaproteobacteria bacterium]|nr:AIR synthase-related protein [Gammaproteobacteria bacterium]